MRSVAAIYIPSFIKIGSGLQKSMGEGGFTDTQTALRLRKPTLGKLCKMVGFMKIGLEKLYHVLCTKCEM
jgi:hypothetical protein